MKLDQFKHKKVAVIGTGVEGLAMAGFLHKLGAFVTICDKKSADEISSEDGGQRTEDRSQKIENSLPPEAMSEVERAKGGKYQIKSGEGYLDNLDQFDIIVRSPGVPWLTPELISARDRGTPVTSQTEVFLANCPAKIIGVTGTKGKSTTASLIAHILSTSGQPTSLKLRGSRKVRLGGNIGEPIIDWLDDLNNDEIVILELSSFQLQGLSVSPQVAVVLDIGTEHLNHHLSRDEYVMAKRTIVEHQKSHDIAVIDADSLTAVEYAASTLAKVWWFSRKMFVDPGVYIKDIAGERWFEGRNHITEKLIMPISDVKLVGEHALGNVAAASAVALALEISEEIIAEAVATFAGLPHRLHNLGQFSGRLWIDDAYATAPSATIAAIESLFDQTYMLITGGSSKGYGFLDLAEAILHRPPRAIIYIGQTGREIKLTVESMASKQNIAPPQFVDGGDSMHEIIQNALKSSHSNDTILFSPASASFGLFANARDRADQFVGGVKQLQKGSNETA